MAFPSLTMKVERVAGPGWARRRSWGRQLPGAPITTTSHFTSHLTRDTLKPLTRDTRHVSPPTAGCHMAVLVLLLQRTGGCSCRASLCSAAVLQWQCRGRTGEQSPAPGQQTYKLHRNNDNTENRNMTVNKIFLLVYVFKTCLH